MKIFFDTLLHSAWEPLTPRGVVAFTRASVGRLLLAQLIFAIAAAVAVVWFLQVAWFPIISDAISQLPKDGDIRRGQLFWRGDTPARLAANHFLSLGVDEWHEGDLGNESHLSVEFGRTNVRFRSILGYVETEYPRDWAVQFNQPKLEPWWGAWQPGILAGVIVAVVADMLGTWALLATLYFVPVWLLAFYANRDLNLRGSWQLAAAALMPGALFMTLTIGAYGLGWLDLVYLGWCLSFHFIIGWIYLLVCVLLLPRHPEVAAMPKNPFVTKP
jgi:hypothetical protein